MDKAQLLTTLMAALQSAKDCYDELVAGAESITERSNWKIDADNVEQALTFVNAEIIEEAAR